MQRSYAVARVTLAIFSILSLAAVAAAGEPVPFKGRLAGVHVSRTPLAPPVFFDVFQVAGEGTHLGKYELRIEAIVDFGTLPPRAAGTFMFTAANGDQVVAEFTGSSALVVPGLVLITERATIDPDRSTGRFAGATGTFTLTRLADAATGVTGITSGSFEGTISLLAPGRP